MPIVALFWGILAMVGFTFGLIPCFGWMNWLNIPFAVGGAIFSIVAFAVAKGEGQPVNLAVIGLALSTVAVTFGAFRLLLGGGLL